MNKLSAILLFAIIAAASAQTCDIQTGLACAKSVEPCIATCKTGLEACAKCLAGDWAPCCPCIEKAIPKIPFKCPSAVPMLAQPQIEEEPQVMIGQEPVDLIITSEEVGEQAAGEQDDAPHWIFLVFQRVSPCEQSAAENQCAGSPRDVAICLAQSPTELAPECEDELIQGAMAHDDIDVLTLMANREIRDILTPADEPIVKEYPMTEMSMAHHGRDAQVHPIVTTLRKTCTADFQKGICEFALAKRVCPKQLLSCLAKHKQELSQPCVQTTRKEIMMVIERENDPVRMACNILASVLFMMAIFFLVVCCCKAIGRCCACFFSSTVVAACAPSPSSLEEQYMLAGSNQPVSSEAQELEMALMLSAAEAGKVTAHDQV